MYTHLQPICLPCWPPFIPHEVEWGGTGREDIDGFDEFDLGKQFDTRIEYARAQFSMMHPFKNQRWAYPRDSESAPDK